MIRRPPRSTQSRSLAASDVYKRQQAEPGQDLLWPGEFVFGYPGQQPDAPDFTVKGPVTQPPVPFMANGAFLVFRRLAQLVPEFNHQVQLSAGQTGGGSDPA